MTAAVAVAETEMAASDRLTPRKAMWAMYLLAAAKAGGAAAAQWNSRITGGHTPYLSRDLAAAATAALRLLTVLADAMPDGFLALSVQSADSTGRADVRIEPGWLAALATLSVDGPQLSSSRRQLVGDTISTVAAGLAAAAVTAHRMARQNRAERGTNATNTRLDKTADTLISTARQIVINAERCLEDSHHARVAAGVIACERSVRPRKEAALTSVHRACDRALASLVEDYPAAGRATGQALLKSRVAEHRIRTVNADSLRPGHRRMLDSDDLTALAAVSHVGLCKSVAASPHTPAAALARLAASPAREIRLLVAGHANSETATLTGLAFDPDSVVADAAAAQLRRRRSQEIGCGKNAGSLGTARDAA